MFGKKNPHPEILVYVKTEPIDQVFKKRVTPSSDGLKNMVIMTLPTKDKAGWEFDVTGAIRTGPQGLYCEVFQGAQKAIYIDTKNHNFQENKLTNDEAQGLLNLKIFKAHYGNMLKDLLDAIKPILIIMAILIVISIAVGAYAAYEVSKIPQIAITVTPAPSPPVVVG